MRAAELLLVTVPLYGSLPELAQLAASSRRLVSASERAPEETRLRVEEFGREDQPLLTLWSVCEIAAPQPVFDNRLPKVTLANGTVVEHVQDTEGTWVRTTTTPA